MQSVEEMSGGGLSSRSSNISDVNEDFRARNDADGIEEFEEFD